MRWCRSDSSKSPGVHTVIRTHVRTICEGSAVVDPAHRVTSFDRIRGQHIPDLSTTGTPTVNRSSVRTARGTRSPDGVGPCLIPGAQPVSTLEDSFPRDRITTGTPAAGRSRTVTVRRSLTRATAPHTPQRTRSLGVAMPTCSSPSIISVECIEIRNANNDGPQSHQRTTQYIIASYLPSVRLLPQGRGLL